MTITPRRLTRFYRKLRNVVLTEDPMDAMLFDCQGLAIFTWLVEHVTSPEQPIVASVRQLADELMMGRYTLTRRLQLLARYAVLKVETGIFETNGQRRASNRVLLNPLLLEALKDGAERMSLVKALVAVGLWRGDGGSDLQGFHSHVPFGNNEPVLKPGLKLSSDVGSELFNLAGEKAKEVPAEMAKRAKAAEREATRARHNDWVTRAGTLWTAAQVAAGRMKATDKAAPAWVLAQTGTLKKERDELAKLLEAYGGMRTGMAWMYFCTQHAMLGPDDKPIFRLDIPHVQYVSVDKKPTQFAKHFSAILGDKFFQKDEQDPVRQDRVRHYFGELATYMPAAKEPTPVAAVPIKVLTNPDMPQGTVALVTSTQVAVATDVSWDEAIVNQPHRDSGACPPTEANPW